MNGREVVSGGRLGRCQLEGIAASLGQRDKQILVDLARFRLLSGSQVRRLHFSAHASVEAGGRAARAALRRLRGLGLIRPLERRIGGVRAGSEGYVWHLSSGGQRLLVMLGGVGAVGARIAVEPSGRMTAHTLAVSEVVVWLVEAARAGQVEVLELTCEPACWRSYLGVGGSRLTLKPDLFAVTALPGSRFEDAWFIEVDLASESRATVEGKAAAYEAYRRSGREQAERGVFPLVLWLTPSQQRADVILGVVASSSRVDRRLHRVAAMEDLITAVANPVGSEQNTRSMERSAL